MYAQFFGSYLLSKGIVNPGQLRDAMDYQNNASLKLGVLAVNNGYMTLREVQNVHSMQSKMDKKFGELAVEMGYLDRSKLERLLLDQKQGRFLLGQTLVDKEYITPEQLGEAISDYKAEYSVTDNQLTAFQSGSENEAVKSFFKFEGDDFREFYQDYLSLFFRNLIRFIDSSITPGNIEGIDDSSYEWAALQEIKGEVGLYTCICGDENSFVSFGSKYAGENFDSVNEMVQMSVGEFLNMQNGIFLVNMSSNDMELEMDPQETKRNLQMDFLKPGYRLPLDFPFGRLYLIIKALHSSDR